MPFDLGSGIWDLGSRIADRGSGTSREISGEGIHKSWLHLESRIADLGLAREGTIKTWVGPIDPSCGGRIGQSHVLILGRFRWER